MMIGIIEIWPVNTGQFYVCFLLDHSQKANSHLPKTSATTRLDRTLLLHLIIHFKHPSLIVFRLL